LSSTGVGLQIPRKTSMESNDSVFAEKWENQTLFAQQGETLRKRKLKPTHVVCEPPRGELSGKILLKSTQRPRYWGSKNQKEAEKRLLQKK